MVDQQIRVRRVRPGDAAELERLYAELDETSRERRFHDRAGHVDARAAAAFANADHRRREGFVAVDGSRIVGHLVLDTVGGDVDEVAIVVDQRVRHRGVGSLLMAAAFAAARLRSVRSIVARVMADNDAARHLIATSSHPGRLFWEGDVARYEIDVPPVPSRA